MANKFNIGDNLTNLIVSFSTNGSVFNLPIFVNGGSTFNFSTQGNYISISGTIQVTAYNTLDTAMAMYFFTIYRNTTSGTLALSQNGSTVTNSGSNNFISSISTSANYGSTSQHFGVNVQAVNGGLASGETFTLLTTVNCNLLLTNGSIATG